MDGEPSGPRRTGSLFVVATPIGNLEDLTFRALRILGEVEAIACEDTRVTLRLLTKYGLKKRLLSYFHPHEGRRIPEVLGLLESGKDVALVSDAGTPGISDPGFPLIRECLKAGIPVVPIPGPSAATAALCASGLATHRFLFLGFPPPKKAGRRKLLASVAKDPSTLVFYLPTRKIAEFLEDILDILGDRRVVIAREISKIHEEFERACVRELIAKLEGRTLRGEATVCIEGYHLK
jgi:16S rRNA (cytidine1402-2'-O)-methyltransferase